MIIERINNWFHLSKQYFFTYKDGFFNLTYLSNSPELIVKSCIKMPFMKVDQDRQLIYTDTPFSKGEFKYAKLEEGLWAMNTEITYKNNVSYKPIFDKITEATYYCICINIMENNFNTNILQIGNYKIKNHSLTFLKPKTDCLHCHFKGAIEKKYFVYFSKEWAEKNILNSENTPSTIKDLLCNDDNNCINYPYDKNDFHELIKNFEYCFDNSLKPNIFELKKVTYRFFDHFFNSFEKSKTTNTIKLKPREQIRIEKVEHYLTANLLNKFPGIEQLSKKFNVSPTKLKQNFKLNYNTSIYQYFQDKQMELAFNYLKNQKLLVKDVSQIFSYQNVSKFSSAFKKKHNILPSEINTLN